MLQRVCVCVAVCSYPVIPSCLFCDPVASRCCIVSVRKPTGTRVIAEEVTTSPKKSDNRRLWVEQSIGVLGKSTPDTSTSPRCGFQWVALQLQEALEEKRRWDDSTVEGGYDAHHYCLHCVEIDRASIRHVIGVRGRMLRKIEDFCGVFIMIADSEDFCEVSLLGLPSACILGAFILEMLERGYYSIMESLIRHGW